MAARAILTILKDGEKIRSQSIDGEVMLGRAEGCVIRLDDRAISRQHAVLRPTADGIQIDKKSEFAPLMVNGTDCTSAVMKEGDVISIGPYLLRLAMEKNDSVPVRASAAALAPPSGPTPTPARARPEVLAANSASAAVSSFDAPTRAFSSSPPPLESVEASIVAESGLHGHALALMDHSDHGPGALELNGPVGEFTGLEGSIRLEGMESPSGHSPGAEVSRMVGENDATRLLPASNIEAKLIFPEGQANVTEWIVPTDGEGVMGRDEKCAIVLSDRKASRQHASLRKQGGSYLLRDLDSANGVYVNGTRLEGERALSGGDRIRIGDSEFTFQADAADYAQRAPGFLEVPAEEGASSVLEMHVPESLGGSDEPGGSDSIMEHAPNPYSPEAFMSSPAASQPMMASNFGATPLPDYQNHAGIPGMGGPAAKKSKSVFLDKFRAMPPRQQMIYGICGLAVIGMLMFDDDSDTAKVVKTKKPAAHASPTPGASPGPMTFDRLSEDKKKFVESQHAMAFEYYKNHDYDKAIYEIQKIFALVADYKNAREIERYAQDGKRKLEALEEEKRKKEEEAKLKAKLDDLIKETVALMQQKNYDQAQILFGEVLALDPENTQVTDWKRQIDAEVEKKKLEEQQQEIRREINRRAYAMLGEGLALRARGKCHQAIVVFHDALAIEATDHKPAARAKQGIAACHATIQGLRDPVLADAKSAEESGELAKAFKLFRKATVIDPPHPAGYAGMNRIRKVLHDRAKVIYTEAVVAESYSDFEAAKKKYRECLEVAPEDDIYFERSTRKLGRYPANKEEAAPQ